MYRVFVLGAGFSHQAGLPLGNELFVRIIQESKKGVLYENILKADIEDYIDYIKATSGKQIIESEIDLEKFASFLDIQHLLYLRGSDTWSSEGNRSQIVIRNLIGLILNNKIENMNDSEMSLYNKFASKLDTKDFVITFNYDTILEKALEAINKPYRLFPQRFSAIHSTWGEVDTTHEEVVILKLHGSIDWFDITAFNREISHIHSEKNYQKPHHIIFSNLDKFYPDKIIDEPYFQDSKLQNIYKIKNLDRYYSTATLVEEVPLIVSPSYVKISYLNPLEELWGAFHGSGMLNSGIAIIGFSIPEHDEYIKQPLYSMITDFLNSDTKKIFSRFGIKKLPLKFVDYRKEEKDQKEYQKIFQFIDWEKTDPFYGGFNDEAIDYLFDK